jgi:adhesin transport system membrane fusion protein
MGQFKDGLRRYFKGSDSLGGQPLPEVNKALIEDAPRVVRLTIWGVILFFVFLIVWASVAPIDEVTGVKARPFRRPRCRRSRTWRAASSPKSSPRKGRSSKWASRCCAWMKPASPPTSVKPRPTAWPWPCGSNAERRGQDSPLKIDEELRKAAPSQAASEESLYQSRRQQLQDEIGGLQQQLVQRQQELREYSSKRAQYANSLELLRKEIGMSEPLVATGAISQVEVLRLRRAEVENRGQLDSTTGHPARRGGHPRGAKQDRRDPWQVPQRSADPAERSAHRTEQGHRHQQGAGRPGHRTWSLRRCAVSSSNCW